MQTTQTSVILADNVGVFVKEKRHLLSAASRADDEAWTGPLEGRVYAFSSFFAR